LNRICLGYVKRYCNANGILIGDSCIAPQTDEKGTKTEKTIIHILSDSEEKRIYTFVVWAFGIKQVTERPFDPDTDQPSPNET
jgi:hypothetical protein